MHPLVKKIEKKSMTQQSKRFQVGDTVKVHTKILEGDKERVQIYNGVVVARRGSGLSETFTVARVAFGYANEKVFPVHSPAIKEIEVLRKGKNRRAKLNHIRGKLGKASKIRVIFGSDDNAQMGSSEAVLNN